jgi:hypothetical protein
MNKAAAGGRATTAGYSGTPLSKKLGIKPGSVVHAVDAPTDYAQLLAPLPNGVRFAKSAGPETDVIHVFAKSKAVLKKAVAAARKRMRSDAALWASWPKKASGVATDITEDTVREVAFPLGLVDVKVCAVDHVWSGLKLVVRKTLR